MDNVIFYPLALIAVAAALGMLFSRNAVHSALFLVLNFMTIAVMYIVLNAPFIAMVQITVYAGAIMVLFLFVIMLLGAEKLRGANEGEIWQRGLAGFLFAGLLVTFVGFLAQSPAVASVLPSTMNAGPDALGFRLFESYILPFELTGFLLLVAMIGVVVLSPKKGEKKNA